MAGKTEVFETWQCDWMCEFTELQEEPTTEGQKLILKVPVSQLHSAVMISWSVRLAVLIFALLYEASFANTNSI